MDRLREMATFVRVVDTGSFSAAARQLRIGQPAVSKTVAQLEDRLQVRLLVRSSHALAPTARASASMSGPSLPFRKLTRPSLKHAALVLDCQGVLEFPQRRPLPGS